MTRLDLAAVLGVHPMTITKWERDGLPIAERGRKGVASRYREEDVRRWVRQREADALAGRTVDVAQERARKERALAAESEQRYQLRAGFLMTTAEVDRLWSGEVAAVRSLLLALPATSADQITRTAILDGVAGVERALDKAVRQILTELANPDRTIGEVPTNGNGHGRG